MEISRIQALRLKRAGRKGALGLSLVEVLVAVTILSIGVLAFIASFGAISKAVHVSRIKTLATNLAQEKIENMKNIPYYKLGITTQAAADNNYSPALYYDPNYPVENIKIGGINFRRDVIVYMAEVQDGEIISAGFNYPDTGMKAVTVYVKWYQDGQWRYKALDNIYENPVVDPLLASVKGRITYSGSAVPGAEVHIIENPDWRDTADTDGSYSIAAVPGVYTLRASSQGYSSSFLVGVDLSSVTVPTKNMTLTPIASGTVVGVPWINSGLVISQVVQSTTTDSDNFSRVDVEYVELFNPTTYSIDIGETMGAKPHRLNYYDEDGGADDATDPEFNWIYVATHVGPGQYFLYANASYFHILGEWVWADAYTTIDGFNAMNANEGGSLQLVRTADAAVMDTVGWMDADAPVSAPYVEGDYIPDPSCSDGPGAGTQMVRVSSPLLVSDDYGRAYDSGSNLRDFYHAESACLGGTAFPARPHSMSSTSAQLVGTGKPAIGAFVTADDLLGATTQAYQLTIASGAVLLPYAYFELRGVSTGTWTVIVASGSYIEDVDDVVVTHGAKTLIPNAVTDPVNYLNDHAALFLSSGTVEGFVSGRVTTAAGVPISGIEVRVGVNEKATSATGTYFMSSSTGTVSVVANSGNANSQYVESISQAAVNTGQITTQNFVLTEGGTIMGFVSSDGTSLMPNTQVAASIAGVQYGLSTSDSSGIFYIRNLTTGTYTVAPVLDPMETYSPLAVTVTVAPMSTVHAGTFTISGAMGSLSGSVTNAGESVTSGALIIVSTKAIGSSPATIDAAVSPAQAVVYSASSLADGTYSVDIRGSSTETYFVSAFIPVINGATVTVTTKTYSGVTVTANNNTSLDIEIP